MTDPTTPPEPPGKPPAGPRRIVRGESDHPDTATDAGADARPRGQDRPAAPGQAGARPARPPRPDLRDLPPPRRDTPANVWRADPPPSSRPPRDPAARDFPGRDPGPRGFEPRGSGPRHPDARGFGQRDPGPHDRREGPRRAHSDAPRPDRAGERRAAAMAPRRELPWAEREQPRPYTGEDRRRPERRDFDDHDRPRGPGNAPPRRPERGQPAFESRAARDLPRDRHAAPTDQDQDHWHGPQDDWRPARPPRVDDRPNPYGRRRDDRPGAPFDAREGRAPGDPGQRGPHRAVPSRRENARPSPDRPDSGHRPPEAARPPRPDAPARADQRLSKLIAERGIASRREADEWIEAGWVKVDGEMAVLGMRVLPTQAIEIDPAARTQQARRVTILLHKPIGYVSGQAEDGYEPASVLVAPENHWAEDPSRERWHPGHGRHLAPAGRLDIDSTGLLVLTQDGRIARHLIGDDSDVEKEYLVRVEFAREGPFPERELERLRHGLWLDGRELRPAKVSWANEDQLRFVLREGRKRQIRRMCEAVGLVVTGLKRVRIGSVVLGKLPQGQWRYLRDDERF